MSDELIHPYCGGCGHRFFNENPIPIADAAAKAKVTRCCYCLEDEKVRPQLEREQARLDAAERAAEIRREKEAWEDYYGSIE